LKELENKLFSQRSGVDNLTYPSQPSFTPSRNRMLLLVV